MLRLAYAWLELRNILEQPCVLYATYQCIINVFTDRLGTITKEILAKYLNIVLIISYCIYNFHHDRQFDIAFPLLNKNINVRPKVLNRKLNSLCGPFAADYCKTCTGIHAVSNNHENKTFKCGKN